MQNETKLVVGLCRKESISGIMSPLELQWLSAALYLPRPNSRALSYPMNGQPIFGQQFRIGGSSFGDELCSVMEDVEVARVAVCPSGNWCAACDIALWSPLRRKEPEDVLLKLAKRHRPHSRSELRDDERSYRRADANGVRHFLPLPWSGEQRGGCSKGNALHRASMPHRRHALVPAWDQLHYASVWARRSPFVQICPLPPNYSRSDRLRQASFDRLWVLILESALGRKPTLAL